MNAADANGGVAEGGVEIVAGATGEQISGAGAVAQRALGMSVERQERQEKQYDAIRSDVFHITFCNKHES